MVHRPGRGQDVPGRPEAAAAETLRETLLTLAGPDGVPVTRGRFGCHRRDFRVQVGCLHCRGNHLQRGERAVPPARPEQSQATLTEPVTSNASTSATSVQFPLGNRTRVVQRSQLADPWTVLLTPYFRFED